MRRSRWRHFTKTSLQDPVGIWEQCRLITVADTNFLEYLRWSAIVCTGVGPSLPTFKGVVQQDPSVRVHTKHKNKCPDICNHLWFNFTQKSDKPWWRVEMHIYHFLGFVWQYNCGIKDETLTWTLHLKQAGMSLGLCPNPIEPWVSTCFCQIWFGGARGRSPGSLPWLPFTAQAWPAYIHVIRVRYASLFSEQVTKKGLNNTNRNLNFTRISGGVTVSTSNILQDAGDWKRYSNLLFCHLHAMTTFSIDILYFFLKSIPCFRFFKETP